MADELLTEDLCQTFKALGDSSRLKILMALEHQEMCVCDLAALLGISESAVSHQLRLLRTLRLVKNRRDGTILYYRLNDDHVSQLVGIALEHIQE
jgi:DNA-binding transcriptional ArsR family regulator